MTVSMPSRLAALACAGALLVVAPAPVAAWNAATHAWLTRGPPGVCGPAAAQEQANRIYGANALDLFNNDFTVTGQTLQQLLHDPGRDLFLSPWWAAETDAEAAFAFGFAAHNNAWGQDSTAHLDGLTNRLPEGWIIWKARLLAPGVAQRLAPYGIVLPEPTLQLVSHILVEQAVDFLLVARDPTLPGLLVDSALARDAAVPELLVRAFAGDFAPVAGSPEAAAALIRLDEALFRMDTVRYGSALGMPGGRLLVEEAIGQQAEAFLGLPPGTGAALQPVIHGAIDDAMALCARDFMWELWATRLVIDWRLLRHGLRP
jgi:hypothetical protein